MKTKPQKLFIPELGSRLKLSKDWSFTLHPEHRNLAMYTEAEQELQNRLRYNDPNRREVLAQLQRTVKLPKGTVLQVDRIYIRAGAKDFSSVTFRLVEKKARFWVKLDEVNSLEFTPELTEQEVKFPEGRFTAFVESHRCRIDCTCRLHQRMYEGGTYRRGVTHLPTCAELLAPVGTFNMLKWEDDYKSQKGVKVTTGHVVIKDGQKVVLDALRPDPNLMWQHRFSTGYRRSGPGYKHFRSLTELTDWAREKGFSDDHIKAFKSDFRDRE
jgi:hypothetical protein